MKYSNLIKSVIAKECGVEESEVILTVSSVFEHGDLTTNIALIEAQKKGVNPKELADDFLSRLSNHEKLQKTVSKIEVAGPGFINFWLSPQALIENLQDILNSKMEYGTGDTLTGQKITVEYAHPNTHKELHIGHMRTLILGESLARVHEALGATVFRANYQGDIGPHVAKSIWGTEKLLVEKALTWDLADNALDLFEKAHLLGEGYVRGNKEYEEHKEEIDALNKQLYAHDESVMDVYNMTRRWSLEYYDMFYKRFNTSFDELYFESDVASLGKEIVLKNVGKVFEESQDAIIFPGEKYGLHTRVFITKDGNPTYEAKDVGLANIQFEDFAFDRIIHVVASEQKPYFQVIFKALELLDEKFASREFHLSMGMVQLVGKKMSSRTGEILTVDSLIDQVKKAVAEHVVKSEDMSDEDKDNVAEVCAIAAIKYWVIKVNPQKDVLFDIQKSIDVEGDSGPYLLYTYARSRSVIGKSKKRAETESVDFSKLNDNEVQLMRVLSQYSGILVDVSKNYSSNLLCEYLHQLSQSFNSFYSQNKIIDEPLESFRLALTAATAQVLKNGLNVLGIETLEKM